MMLYHATNRDLLAKIAQKGLNPGTYLASMEDVVHYYAETVEDDGAEVVILAVSMDRLNATDAEPDYAGIDEPITSTIGMSEDKIHEAWAASSQTWEDSLTIIGSLRYRAAIPPMLISVVPECYDDLAYAKLTRLSYVLDQDSSPAFN